MTSFSQIAPVLQCHRAGAAGSDSRLIRNGVASACRRASTAAIAHRDHLASQGGKVAAQGIAATCNFNKFAWRVPIYIRLTWVHKRACCRAAHDELLAVSAQGVVAHYAVSGFRVSAHIDEALSFDGCAYRTTRPRPSSIGGASTDPFFPGLFLPSNVLEACQRCSACLTNHRRGHASSMHPRELYLEARCSPSYFRAGPTSSFS
jgi:hypothetical protein